MCVCIYIYICRGFRAYTQITHTHMYMTCMQRYIKTYNNTHTHTCMIKHASDDKACIGMPMSIQTPRDMEAAYTWHK